MKMMKLVETSLHQDFACVPALPETKYIVVNYFMDELQPDQVLQSFLILPSLLSCLP
jgi:hypothetical protein